MKKLLLGMLLSMVFVGTVGCVKRETARLPKAKLRSLLNPKLHQQILQNSKIMNRLEATIVPNVFFLSVINPNK